MTRGIALALALAGCTVHSTPPPQGPPPAQPPPPAAEPVPAPAPPPVVWSSAGWVLLGDKWVDGARDRDVIEVGRDEGRFKQLTLVVEGSDVEILDLDVKFGNGKAWDVPVRQFFREGERTRVIDLPGDRRFIKRIAVRYANLPGGGRAHVQFWAR
jgi:hypothetical protein